METPKSPEVNSRECSKKGKQVCKQERALQREMMHMEAELNDGESVLPQFHNMGPRRMEGKKMKGVEVAAGCLTNALRACTDRHFKFSDTLGNVSKKGKSAWQKACSMLKVFLMPQPTPRVPSPVRTCTGAVL